MLKLERCNNMSAIDIFELLYEPFKLDPSRPVRLFEAFSGIGTQHLALKRLGLEVDLVGISEVDKFAIASYEAIHGKVKNYGGIGTFDRLPANIDIATWSFPCQDISQAGTQRGMTKGTQSNYGYVFLDTVENTPKDERPQVLLMENVRALFSETFKYDWREIQLRLERMGYKNYAELLIATDYGIPQTRERIFIVSILGDYSYKFPRPIRLERILKDFLETEVDDKYVLSKRMIRALSGIDYEGDFPRAEQFQPHDIEKDKIAKTITTRAGGRPTDNFIIMPENTIKGYAKAYDGDGVYINRPHQKRGVVQRNKIQTLKTQQDVGVVERALNGELRIRKLTPIETWRLMGVSDADFHKANKVTSDSQLYKQAGNAIVVDVLYHIFREMLIYEAT